MGTCTVTNLINGFNVQTGLSCNPFIHMYFFYHNVRIKRQDNNINRRCAPLSLMFDYLFTYFYSFQENASF